MQDMLHPSNPTLLPNRYAHIQTIWLQEWHHRRHTCKGCDVQRRGDRRRTVERHVMLNTSLRAVTIISSAGSAAAVPASSSSGEFPAWFPVEHLIDTMLFSV